MAGRVLYKCKHSYNLLRSLEQHESFSNLYIKIGKNLSPVTNFRASVTHYGSAARAETTSTTQGLSKLQAQELVLRLNQEERQILLSALQEYQSKLVKDELEGQLAASRWRSKFGRPSKLPTLGDVDPTGSYCQVPEDWLKKKCAESVPKPTNKNLIDSEYNLLLQILFPSLVLDSWITFYGDYIDLYLGSYLCISTMAAAALGNTFSDVLGIGSAFYVERLANKIGYSPPKLSPIQMDMSCSRNSANIGRVLGVTLGCLLGMFPLLFRKSKKEEEKDE
ncbi:hypothetical protein HHI36_008142 [Cryptolaemus montrouzieri]|uniref:Transmembrane protein 65 n=1 Tax=Cryptolaemus montrouzieri TaxID=559131 RepID=A0ABD2MS29_9CUCU